MNQRCTLYISILSEKNTVLQWGKHEPLPVTLPPPDILPLHSSPEALQSMRSTQQHVIAISSMILEHIRGIHTLIFRFDKVEK